MHDDEDLLASYKKAYDRKVGFGRKPALIMIDFCMGYFDPACELYADVDAELASALRLRAAARAAGVPVILTNVVYHPSTIDGGRFFEKAAPLRHFIQGSPMGAWAPGLAPHDDELVVSKQYPSAFFGTTLASTLTAMGVDSVLLTGLTTSGCVRASCVDAMSHGFRTAVIADACGDRHPAPHQANLFDMNAKYADVVTEAEALAYLSGLKN
ncbi:MAG: isochorismatase [Novosphingobium sp. 28-62-57]|uniref:isochorismatase family protein n=1 Tax=unclassified Novosphingobium TaxID=2644732 RepID=UPI000BCBB066|nr:MULTISPECIES: isochorismatase family protein [unclassified Novosphingobium]OYW51305.1 MAG: isochorismatase [Novosphingobium sp. 12-62-10]OYZ45640.1 MAG: isochorismatase [Novosphingobium sp. 16-62-11]OZA40341.1 MAG: isochorismatase [Novosphingobium sp. 17-62-9]OYZ10626.1 MAG: isochorismatase [Novosphingobium sp. 28-62-57]HQS68030.1 isochorismatase family protein [Novosphingobium sp.]